ncbi:endonuclease domain-containing protein [Sphingomonas crocodyli]|uniref:endonuclease domain-containing protein n=1 Tax=Sphingomonas crocodyli TaxID=1979270 RepID=UPI001F0C515B|nr:DUF559 domain-containing protein [Sphingomonas crocodyli]
MRRPEVNAARKLRKDMSLPEVLLWDRLRAKRLGVKFRRQHPVGPYVVDFCSDTQLVVEIDGEAHDRGTRPTKDNVRDAFLRENGYDVFRLMASEVLRDLDAVVTGIAARVASPLHHPSDGPPPRAGEELQ